MAPIEAVAKDINASGGFAEVAIVDAPDEKAVNDFALGLVKKAGSIDISFNAIGLDDVHGITIIEMNHNEKNNFSNDGIS